MVRTRLSRNLSLFSATMIGVGAMIGAGIFVLTGIAAGIAGPAFILAFLLNGIVAFFTASAYAELGGTIPEAGGGYLWVKEALPPPMGFLSGWMSWMAHSVACSLYAVGFGAYFAEFLNSAGIKIISDAEILKKILAFILVSVFTYINYKGVKETGIAQTIVTILKILILSIFILLGLFFIFRNPSSFSHFTPFIPKGTTAILIAMGLTFIAFEGYEIIAQSGEEIINPRRNIPRAIFYSLLIVVPIYLFVGFVALGVVEPGNLTAWDFLGLKKEIGLIEAAKNISSFGGIIIMIGGLFSTISALNATIYSSSRVSFAMGRDHNLPQFFSKIHSRFKTPFGALFGSYLIIVLTVFLLPIEDIAFSADIMFLFLFILVNLSLIHLRNRKGRIFKGYKSPLFPLFPLLGILTQLLLIIIMFIYSFKALSVTLIWIISGIAVYYSYSRIKEKEEAGPKIVVEEREPIKSEFKIIVGIEKFKDLEYFAKIAFPIAKYNKGEIIITHILTLPPQTPLGAGKRLIEKWKSNLEKIDKLGDKQGIPVSYNIMISHNVARALIEISDEYTSNILLVGLEAQPKRKIFGRVLSPIFEKANSDIGFLKLIDFNNIRKIMIPTAGGPNARLALKWGIMLAKEYNAEIGLVRVIRNNDNNQTAQKCLADTKKGIKFVRKYVKDIILKGDDVYKVLNGFSENYDLIILGASKEKLWKRVRFGTIPEKFVKESKKPILIAKKYEGKVLSWIRNFLVG
ncbi:amino acid permease [Candidatus Aminicenantes bacterium AC-335-A11]|jgi:amino acid transporter|nr:amino acid permease [SCandidatus Aminicenantes bacterium Aminicenantia_JdfR_composite]MCP2598426.1 amino acid permease [Candidatus Aminicenantes bacterium AC-335-L06]MCP2618434.1 amino acid permease [Candidatus Aminicenantes bacterium AC-335-A11]